MHRHALLFLTLIWCCGSLRADWPHLRGPNYDGVSEEASLLDSWPEKGPPLLWSRELGQGHSGFVAAEGKIYTQRQALGGQFLVCLDPTNGQTLWEFQYDWSWQPKGPYPGPYASPTLSHGKVFYAAPTGLVGCVDAQTGNALWSLNVKDRFQGKGWDFGYGATPLVEDDRCILPVGGPGASLVALHVDDGRVLWAAGDDSASYCGALPITLQGRRLVVGYLQNSLLLVEMDTGKVVHRQSLSAGYDEHSAWPVYREPHLLLTSPFRVPAQQFCLETNDAGLTVRPRWTSKDMCNDLLASVLYKEHVYGFDLKQWQASPHRTSRGTFRCLDWATGKTRWTTEEVGHTSVLAADDKLLLFNDTGALILARADPERYGELGRVQLFEEAICWTPPLLWKGKLFVRGGTLAMCLLVGKLDAKTGPLPTVHVERSLVPGRDWLIGRERDYPNDALSWGESNLWFACSLVLFGAALLLTSLCKVLQIRVESRTLYWLFLFVLGLPGTRFLSHWLDQCVFTLPVCVYAGLHITIRVCRQAQQAQKGAWLARGSIVLFVLLGYGYFELCRGLGMFIAWSFLFGVLPAFPLIALAERPHSPIWARVVWTLLGFAAFFWSSQALLFWKVVH